MNTQRPNMVDMMAICTADLPVALVSKTPEPAPIGVPVVPSKDGWTLFVFRGLNISWTITGRKTGTSLAIRAQKLSYEMVESFDPDVFWKR